LSRENDVVVGSQAEAATQTGGPDYDLRRRRAIWSAYAGFFVDSFDIFVPSVALLPAMIYFTYGMSPDAAILVTAFTFASTLLGRPLGAVIFGHFADRIGRARSGMISIYGFGIVTLIIGLLPGAQQIGAGPAISLLILLRFIDGIFLGGEYTAATPMAIEYTEPRRRGLIGGVIQSSATTGYVAIAVFTLIGLKVAPAGGIDSAYVQWGWRIPFLFGAIIAFLVAHFIRRHVEDSLVWQQAQHSSAPLRDMFTGSSGVAFLQVFLVMTGVFFCANMLGSLMPQLLLAHPGYTPTELTLTLIVCNIPVPFAYILGGMLSDRIGRRPAIIIAGVVTTLVMSTALWLLGSKMFAGNWWALTFVAFFVAASSTFPIGIMPAYINERFPTRSRSSGWGIGYSSATIIPALFVFYQKALTGWMPFEYTPAVLAALGGVLIILGGIVAPETLGTNLAAVDADFGASTPPSGATTSRA
jgi:MFS family permease